jgi:hypothetical protein
MNEPVRDRSRENVVVGTGALRQPLVRGRAMVELKNNQSQFNPFKKAIHRK